MQLNKQQRHKLGDFHISMSLILLGTLVVGQIVSGKPLNWEVLVGGVLSAISNLLIGLWWYKNGKEE